MIKRLGYQTLWRLGLIGLLALTTAACGRDSDQSAPPVTEPTASFTQQVAGLTVSFDASASTGDIASYQWDFGDGSSGVGKTVSHTYAATGDYSVVLTVSDSAGVSTKKIAVVKPNLLGTLSGVAVDDLLAGSTIQVFGYSSDTPSAAELGQSLTDSSGQFQVSFTLQDQTFYRVVLEGGTFPDGRAFLGRMEAVCSISETRCNLSPYSTLVASLLDPQQPPAAQLSLASQRLTQVLGIGSDPFIRELNQEPVLDVDLTAWRQQFANGQGLSTELQNLALDIADGYLEPSANGIFPNGKYQDVNNKPIAAFTHSETDLLASFDANGSSDSDGSIASYSWNFGDGTTGSGKTASHSYTAAGTYTVTLTVTDDKGATASQSVSLSVVAPNVVPTAAFTHSGTDLAASFDASTASDSDGSIASYSWNFGDGTTGSGKTASHSYTAAGTYTVTLTVTDDKGATANQSASVSVVAPNVAPIAAFTHSETDLLASFDANGSSDSDGSIASYSWSFGDGATGTGKSASHSYAVAGTYTVTLTVTDDKGATASQSVSLSVVAPNVVPTAAFTHSETDLAASFDASTASDSDGSIASYSWNFGDGATGSGKTASHSYTAAGTYTVTLTVTDDKGATASQSVSLSVVAPNVVPTAAFTHSETDLAASFDANGSSDSDGSIASYSWNFGDGTTGSGKTASHSYTAAGTYTVTLTVTDDKGATANQSASVSVVAPNVAPTAAFTHSETDLLASFDANGSSDSDGSIASYSWNFGDGTTGSGKTASHSYTAAGTYTVTLTVTDDKGATASQSASVSVVAANQLPIARFSAQVTHLAVQLDGSASTDVDGHIVGYLWNFGEPAVGGENQSAEQKPQHSYQAAGTYSVTLTVTDDRGGEHSLSQSITVDNRIAAVATGKLNDTGITGCADASNWSLPCPVAGFPGQDAESGRDFSANDDSDGHAGFSFTKVSASGEALPVSATEWSCVKDNVTGLLWEIHTDDDGLRDKHNTYSWYNPDASGDAGAQNGGQCSGGISCDTQGYVAAVNAAGLCGYHDWRLPTVLELQGLVDYSIPVPGPTIDTHFFPDTQPSRFWSSLAVVGSTVSAWDVGFGNGYTGGSNKGYDNQLRLVRSEP